MATTVAQLDTAAIDEAERLLTEFLKAEAPTLDLSHGKAIHTVVIHPAAIFYVNDQNNMDLLRNSRSLNVIAANPSAASDALADDLVSNLQLTRDAGEVATGQLAIVLSEATPIIIPAAAEFTVNGLTFTPTMTFTGATTSSNVVGISDRLVTARSDGNWEIIIDAKAAAVGPEYNVAANTRLAAVVSLSSNLVDIVAVTSFTGGRAAETNADLVARAQLGLSPKVMAGRNNIKALLQEQFPAVVDVSAIGCGDLEMLRDSHNIFGAKSGGKVDLYVRTRSTPSLIEIVHEATLDVDTGVWQANFTRDEAAGLYLFEAIVHEDETLYTVDNGGSSSTPVTSLEITDDIRQLDLTGSGFVPSITDVAEGVYSAYQTVAVRFLDPAAPVGTVAQDYKFYAWVMPDIAAIQAFVNDRGRRNPACDYLVKAPIPIFCAVDMIIARRSENIEIDTAALVTAIAAAASGVGFSLGKLPSSVLTQAAATLLPSGAVVDYPVPIIGMLRKPSGTEQRIYSERELVAPNLPEESVSSRTTAFFLPSNKISVSVVNLDTAEV